MNKRQTRALELRIYKFERMLDTLDDQTKLDWYRAFLGHMARDTKPIYAGIDRSTGAPYEGPPAWKWALSTLGYFLQGARHPNSRGADSYTSNLGEHTRGTVGQFAAERVSLIVTSGMDLCAYHDRQSDLAWRRSESSSTVTPPK